MSNIPNPYPQYPPPPPPQPMPPVYFPPPMYYPPAPQRERGGFARAIFTTLAVSILGFSITLNIYLLISQGLFSESGSAIRRDILTAGDPTATIAVVPVEGVIWDRTADEVKQILAEVEADPAVKAVVLEVDSPGGTVTASDEIYARLLQFKTSRGVPLIVSMQSLGASGGYYISCAADQIVAQPTALTGSIGVIWGGLNVADLLEKYGVHDDTLVSTGATYKDAGSPYRKPTAEDLAYRQKLIDDQFVLFKQIVAKGRSLDAKVVDGLANGKVYLGPDAVKLKLVDSVGYLDDAVSLAATRAGVTGHQVVRFSRQPGFWEALGGQQGEAHMVQTQIEGLKIGVDERAIKQLLTPGPQFLYRG